jgi:subtilisin family serine protease
MRKLILASLSVIYLTQWLSPVSAATPLQIAGVILGNANSLISIQQNTPNDPLFSSQSYLSIINAPSAWEVTTGSSIPIAVIDTGIDLSHEDLTNKLWVNSDEIPNNGVDDDHNGYIDDYNGYDFLNNDANLLDVHGHGTGISSIIAAQTNNSKGMAGVNWQAPIMVLKALNSVGGGDFGTVARAIRYAADNGAKVINMSFGAIDNYSDLESAVNYALGKQITIVAAVGNNHGQGIFYPAAYEQVIAVSSVSDSGQFSSFSNFGAGVDLAAPGENILMAGSSANGNSSYVHGSGSSFAAAEVTGVVSLLLAHHPTLSPAQVSSILKNTAVSSSGDPNDIYVGAGRVDAGKAMNYQPRNLAGKVNLSRSTVPADGVTFATVTLTVRDEFNQPQPNLAITLRAGGNNNLVNRVLVSGDTNLGSTNNQGQVSFTIASNVAETKRLDFFSGANVIQASSSSLIFNVTRGMKQSMSWVRQSPYPTIALGDTAKVWVEVKNTGNVAWISDKSATNAKGQMRLGTARPLNRNSNFYDVSSWVSQNRSALMTPNVVRPGETARFEFTVRASQIGQSREYFRPVVEYVTWLNDLGIYWDITVTDQISISPMSGWTITVK